MSTSPPSLPSCRSASPALALWLPLFTSPCCQLVVSLDFDSALPSSLPPISYCLPPIIMSTSPHSVCLLLLAVLALCLSCTAGMSIEVYNSSDCNPASLLPHYSHNWPSLGAYANVSSMSCASNVTDTVQSDLNTVFYYCTPYDGGLIAQINVYNTSAAGCSRKTILTLDYVGVATPGKCSGGYWANVFITDFTNKSNTFYPYVILDCDADTSTAQTASPTTPSTSRRHRVNRMDRRRAAMVGHPL